MLIFAKPPVHALPGNPFIGKSGIGVGYEGHFARNIMQLINGITASFSSLQECKNVLVMEALLGRTCKNLDELHASIQYAGRIKGGEFGTCLGKSAEFLLEASALWLEAWAATKNSQSPASVERVLGCLVFASETIGKDSHARLMALGGAIAKYKDRKEEIGTILRRIAALTGER